MERLRRLGFLIAFLTLGVVIVSLLHGLQALVGQPVALLSTVAIAGVMMAIFVLVALVPSRRYTGWARTITSINTRWLFFLLLLLPVFEFAPALDCSIDQRPFLAQ